MNSDLQNNIVLVSSYICMCVYIHLSAYAGLCIYAHVNVLILYIVYIYRYRHVYTAYICIFVCVYVCVCNIYIVYYRFLQHLCPFIGNAHYKQHYAKSLS